MAENTKHRGQHAPQGESQGNGAESNAATVSALADTSLIVAVEDGKGHGHYIVLPIPEWINSLPDEARAVAIVGLKYEATRKGQSEAKSAAKDGRDVVAAVTALFQNFKPEIKASRTDTVGSKRVEFASKILSDALAKAGQAHDEATVEKALPKALEAKPNLGKRAEADLQAFLAAGYTPTKRGTGAKAGESGADVSGALGELEI